MTGNSKVSLVFGGGAGIYQGLMDIQVSLLTALDLGFAGELLPVFVKAIAGALGGLAAKHYIWEPSQKLIKKVFNKKAKDKKSEAISNNNE